MEEEAGITAAAELEVKKHAAFFRMHVVMLPEPYQRMDTNRMTVLYFALSALDVLNQLTEQVDEAGRRAAVEWVYAQQVGDEAEPVRRGFRGGPFLGGRCCPFETAHIAQTYTALCSLRVLGDDLSRVRRDDVLGALRGLQQADGSFAATPEGSERDMRFVYCACAVATLLGDDAFRSFDADLAVRYVLSCQAHDGAFSLVPGAEGHGGSTYTAVASLCLLGRLESALPPRRRARLVEWLAHNQGGGYRGRTCKPPDTCYSFWCGATLEMLGEGGLARPAAGNRAFNMSCEGKHGGFGKHPDARPDILHSYFGLCGLSLMGTDADRLAPLDVRLGMTRRAAAGRPL